MHLQLFLWEKGEAKIVKKNLLEDKAKPSREWSKLHFTYVSMNTRDNSPCETLCVELFATLQLSLFAVSISFLFPVIFNSKTKPY